MSAAEKVHYIGEQNKSERVEETVALARSNAAEDKTSHDMAKVALFVSILSVVLLVVFFFGLNQNLNGLSSRVDELGVLKDDVAGLSGRLTSAEDKILALEGLPKKAKKMVMGTMLQEMSQRAAYLSSQMETEEQVDKLQKAQDLMQQVQVEMSKE